MLVLYPLISLGGLVAWGFCFVFVGVCVLGVVVSSLVLSIYFGGML